MSPHLDQVIEELKTFLQHIPVFNSAQEGWAAIYAETEELWREIQRKHSDPNRTSRMRKEATQVAAMAIKFLIEMDHFKGTWQ